MGKTTDCSAILVALALALGATPPATADRVILDDFVVDPDFADGEPLTWIADANSRCVAIVHEELGEGLRVEAAGTECAGVLMTSEVFSGDVTIRTQSSVGRQSEAFLHLNLFAATGYSVNVCARNCWDGRQYIVGLVRWDGWDRAPLRLDQSPGFDPNEGDVNLELSSRGEFVECRVWPEGAARPDEPLYRIHDEAYRSGAVAFSADPSFDARPAPALLRWAEITVASPEPEPFLFRRGDSNDDGKVDISDGIHLLGFLFLGGVAPSCNDAADADDSGVLGLTDAVFLFDFLFRGADPPPSPGPSECAQDPTKDDGLECAGAVCP